MTSGLSPLRLPVRTKSGQRLGTVVDVTIDPNTHSIINYYVKPNRLVPDMVWSPLIINQSQIIELNSKEVVVDDAVARTGRREPNPQPTT